MRSNVRSLTRNGDLQLPDIVETDHSLPLSTLQHLDRTWASHPDQTYSLSFPILGLANRHLLSGIWNCLSSEEIPKKLVLHLIVSRQLDVCPRRIGSLLAALDLSRGG
jgi:hypothetical protein